MKFRAVSCILGFLFRKRPSVDSVVDSWFRDDDRQAALEFYRSWFSNGWLVVQLGDGCHELTKEGFFSSGWINFVWPPFEVDGRLLLATDAEDELGFVAMNLSDCAICYVYGDTAVLLADSFRRFLGELKEAGWIPPSAAGTS